MRGFCCMPPCMLGAAISRGKEVTLLRNWWNKTFSVYDIFDPINTKFRS
jgi:hypothetical protein